LLASIPYRPTSLEAVATGIKISSAPTPVIPAGIAGIQVPWMAKQWEAEQLRIKNSMEIRRSYSLGETEATSRPRISTHCS